MTETYRIRSPETWDKARDEYLAGETAEVVCRRHDLNINTFRMRARDGGWRRADQPDPEPIEDDLEAYADLAVEDLVDLAWSRIAQALVRGRHLEAARWQKVHALLHARAQAEANTLYFAPDPVRAPDGSLHPARREPKLDARGRNLALRLQFDSHVPHPVSSGPAPAPSLPPALNRAERRRMEREARQRS